LVVETGGGAGYGRAENRAHEDVLRDIEEGAVSPEKAALVYGVTARAAE